jgi:hypothetical protein
MYSEDGQNTDELLNTEASNQNTINQETYQVFPPTDEPIPTFDEVKNTIQKLKDNKALGIDLIQAELIKKGSPDFIEYMQQLIILKIWTRRLELGYHLSDTQ